MKLSKAIVVKNLTKKYKLYHSEKERLLDLITPKSYGEDFYALSDVDFEANHGEVIGFVGINGSGKSTLSNIIAGIVPETSGLISVNGQVSLIAVAAGLKNDLTGRDNIELKLLMLGFSKPEIELLEPEIIEFAELEKFIDQPVKSYSSGMRSRLGFAISVNVDPEILVIDEALSVGDKAFAEKSLAKMKEFKEEGKTMIFVSHSIGQMKKFCDKILWLEFGKVKEYGLVNEVMPKYEEFLDMWKKLSKDKREDYRLKVMNNKLNYEEFLKEVNPNSGKFIERLVSRMGRIKKEDSYIYESPEDLSIYKSSKPYQNKTFYIKKAIIKDRERFYLLSNEPSSVDGTIGWISSKDVVTHNLMFIDKDPKQLTLNGKGIAFDRPWGSTDNIVIDDLKSFKDQSFLAERTDRLNKRYWYYGRLGNKKVWINQKAITKD